MLLKSLEIHGFKSFPDKTVLRFDRGMTAVVGPNGSGKSNISDAIRWVLGEQSTKSLRGAKMEDVIFNGTEKRRPVGFAEVSLVIDNKDRALGFDADDVKVTRRYYRSGDSEYLLNNASVRLKDIQLLFMDTGLGRDGYSIVGQGRIGDIVASKSNDRREIFEEAAGIAKYRYRKNEAERRLAAAEDNLVRLRDIVTELEERVGPLAAQAEKAKKFLEFAGEKKTLEIGLWLHVIRATKDTLRDLNAKLELARTQYDAAGEAADEWYRQIEEIGRRSAEISARMDELRRSTAATEEQAAALDSRAAVRRNDMAHNADTIERLLGDIAESDSGDDRIREEIARREQEIAEKQAAIAESERQRLAAAEELEGLTKSSDEATDRMSALSEKANALALALSDTRVQSGTAESALTEITLRLSQINASVIGRQQEVAAAKAERDACRKDAAEAEERAESLKNSAEGYRLRAKSRAEKRDAAKETADQLRLDAEEKLRRVRLLEELERSMEGFSGSVKAVIRQAERGALTGILGPVSRLLRTTPEYALAIETALGAAAQNVVCSREEDAKRAIAYLKESKGGRATFLPLSTIKGNRLRENGLDDAPGFVGLACELVQFAPEYAGVADSLLGRVAVAEDLDYAVSLARRFGYRFRIVTLDGQVVNAGGSLTGGSASKNAGLLSRRGEIERLQKEAEALAAKAREAQENWKRLSEEAALVEAEWTGLQGELSTAQEDKIRLDGELRRLEEQLSAGERSLSESAEEIRSLTARAGDCRGRMAEAAERMQALEADKAAVEQEIAGISGGRQQLTEQRSTLSERIAALKLAEVAAQKEIEAAHAAIGEWEARFRDAESYRARLQEQIGQVKEQNTAIEAELTSLADEAAALRAQSASVETQIAKLAEERSEGERQQTVLQQKSREKLDERELAGREAGRLEERCLAAQRESDEVVKKLFEEYELTRSEAEEITEPIADVPAANRRLNELKSKIRSLGSVNVDAIEEYKEVSERYEFLSGQVRDVEVSKAELQKLISELTGQMKELFLERFRQINGYYGEIFAELFGGGTAELSLTDPEDVLGSGIEMKVQPPGKVILNLDVLSGGEKALAAIALLFAILKVTPSPFCVLDEIEAALDDVNVDRYARYIHRMEDKTQFIVITHRRGTMEEADVLYGVTMQEQGVSKLLELRASEVEEKLGLSLNAQ